MCSPKSRVCWGALAGGLFILVGALALTLIPSIIEQQVLDRDWLGYENGTEKLNAMTVSWQKPAYDMRLYIWMYDLTNEEAVMAGAKPHVRQIGPFTFVEKQEKTFNFTANGTRVVYRNNHLYYFSRNLSCADCDLSQNVTIPNIIFQKLVDFSNMGFLQKLAVEAVLVAYKRESAFIKVTVGEALFDGYHDPVIDSICEKPILSSLCKGAQIPSRIGFYYGQNNTNDGQYEVATGLGDPWNIGKVYTWNNLTSVPTTVWDSPYARMINGSDGQLFPPLLKPTDTIHIFAAPICRTISMEFVGHTEFRGVPAFRYSMPQSMYDPSIRENRQFCNINNTPTFFNSTIQMKGCLPAGLLDVGRCQPGEPRIYISQAHFLNAPEEVWSSIEGLDEPSLENDFTAVEIEPTSGVPISAKRIMQVNVGMVKGTLDILSKTQNMIMPVLWMNETATFDDATRDQLKNQLVFIKKTAYMAGVGLTTLGGLVWVVLVAVVLINNARANQSEDEEPILTNDGAAAEVEAIQEQDEQ